MIQIQLKLKPTPRQERQLKRNLWHLSSVWNWGLKKIENDHRDGFHYSLFNFRAILNGHGAKVGISQDAINGTLATVYDAWQRCFKRLGKAPRLKGRRNRLNSIAFAHGTKIKNQRILISGIGYIRYHKQPLQIGPVAQLRVISRASGWYACLSVRQEPASITAKNCGLVGIDPGFSSLLTLSSGEQVDHPREFKGSVGRLGQSQRGINKRLSARLQERIQNQRKDRNHKLSRLLVSENQLIVFSADKHSFIAKTFGKSVSDSAHFQLRRMLAYKSKCRTDGLGVYVEVPSRNSTKTCSACGALSGPTGLSGLKVRQWKCAACGAEHDRDINAAVNTLIAGIGAIREMSAKAA